MAVEGDFTYLSNGDSELRISDGSTTLFDNEGNVIKQITPEGDVYSDFDDLGRPGHVEFKDGTSGDFTYQPGGGSELVQSDGSRTLLDDEGNVIKQITPEGDVYSDFDDLGRPGHVEFQGRHIGRLHLPTRRRLGAGPVRRKQNPAR